MAANMPDAPSIDDLYRNAVRLADRARHWFDGPGQAWRDRLSPDDQAAVATESLATTARLLAVMSWLLDRDGGASPAARGTGPEHPPLRAFSFEAGPELPPGSPLAGQRGGEIARASRHLVEQLSSLAAARPATEPDPSTGHWLL